MRVLLTVACLIALALPVHGQTSPASNTDEPNSPVGVRPYEMDWAKRTEPNHPQLVDFEDLSGWTVTTVGGAKANVYRSQQEMVFGDYTAKAVYSGSRGFDAFVISPPEPISIPGEPTAVNLWVRGNNWAHENPRRTPGTRISAIVRDAAGKRLAILIGHVTFDYWSLMHRTFVSPTGSYNWVTGLEEGAKIEYPLQFEGIEVAGCSDPKEAKLHFDALSFYEIQYPPIQFDKIPTKHPWPTTPDTILPTLKRPVETSLLLEGQTLTASHTDGNNLTRFVYTPTDGTLSDLQILTAGAEFQPCFGGGIEFEAPDQSGRPGEAPARLIGYREVRKEGVQYDWEIETGSEPIRFSYTFRLKGKSLILDLATEKAGPTRFHVGVAKGLPEAKSVFVPYMTFGNDWPRIVCSAGPRTLFLSAMLDWYNTDASEWFGEPTVHDEDAVGYIGGAIYHHKTNGERNPMRERLFITASRDVHEVLPNIPNPKTDTGDVAREFVWRNIAVPQKELLTRYKAYGIDKFIACHHETVWRDQGESFTFRMRVAPRIGDRGLADYGAWLNRIGYRFGTYTNYNDFAPVNGNWNEDDVTLRPDGTWQRAWPRCYSMKPLRSAEKEAWYAPRINEKFNTSAQYCDIHTAFRPWDNCDYDARLPGAAKFSTQFNAYGRLLWNESKAHEGPVFSEGNNHWFYAGIVDGNYACIFPYGFGARTPPLVDFDLLKMHPLETDFGMGFPQMFYGMKGPWIQEGAAEATAGGPADLDRPAPLFDRFHTSTIAYGHIGYLANEWGFDATLKSYYLLQALQKRYTMIEAREIGYFDGERTLDTSAAIATGAYERGQVYTRYASGLDVWTNLSYEHDWTVDVDGRAYLLPPTGFVARKPDDILAYSAILNGGTRHEAVISPDYLFLDTRGAIVRGDMVATRGAVAVKPDGDGIWWVIPATRCDEVTISTYWLGAGPHDYEAFAYNENGDKLGRTEVRRGMRSVTVMASEGAAKYRLQRTAPKDALGWGIHGDLDSLILGQTQGLDIRVSGVEDTPRPERLRVEAVSALGEATEVWSGALEEGKSLTESTAHLVLSLPPSFPPDTRCWFRLTASDSAGKTLGAQWIDAIAVPPFDIDLLPSDVPAYAGKPWPIRARIRSNDPECRDMTARLVTDTGRLVGPDTHSLTFLSGDTARVAEAAWQVAAPDPSEVVQIDIVAEGNGQSSAAMSFLAAHPAEWVDVDLLDLPVEFGFRHRTGPEKPIGTGDTGAHGAITEASPGGRLMRSINMHPPWKDDLVGYSFALFETTVPEGLSELRFALGFQVGSSTADGCRFTILVIDGGRETEIFNEIFAELAVWRERSADLSAFAGKQVQIKFIIDVGPDDNSTSDWPCYGAPRIVAGGDTLAVSTHRERPEPIFLPAPEPLEGLRESDLAKVQKAWITFEGFGVDPDPYVSYFYLNGVEVGPMTPTGSDIWRERTIAVPAKALASLVARNVGLVRNQGNDYMKVRNFCLHFELENGQRGSSYIDRTTRCTAHGWAHSEGEAVSMGEDLGPIHLPIPVVGE